MSEVALRQITQAERITSRGPFQNSSILGGRAFVGQVSLALAWVFLIFGIGILGLRLAGYQYVYARGDSMEPTFSSGSLLIARPTAPEDIRIGDIIGRPGPREGGPGVVHRVVALLKDGERIVAFTMGDNNPIADFEPLTLDRPVERVVLIAPYLGWWMTPTTGWLLLGISALLGLRAALRWKAHKRGRACTEVPRIVGRRRSVVV